MLFYSYEFIFAFLPIVLIGAVATRMIGQRVLFLWLIFASLGFYGYWRVRDLFVVGGSILVNYGLGKVLARHPSRAVLAIGIAFNLLLLGYFKYANFLVQTLNDAAGLNLELGRIILPLAISFFTFQKIAYLVDSYRQRTIPHGFLDYVLFVTFFPQLIAGPIVHQAEMLRQFRQPGLLRVTTANLAIGLTLFAAGLFKKIILADTLAGYADPAFAAATAGQGLSTPMAWAAALSYTFQLYFDFSGYTDMAIGLARMFGIRLPINFDSPYKSLSIIEFWRRWHITLSRFLRDYLYLALGGNRHGQARRYANLMIVMLLGGLWHGANWTFVAWGGLHGLYLVVNHGWRAIRARVGPPGGVWTARIGRVLAWTCTFAAVVVAWVFFRADDLTSALLILKSMAGLQEPAAIPSPRSNFVEGLSQGLWLSAALFIVTALPNVQQLMIRCRPALGRVRFPARWLGWMTWRPSLGFALLSGACFVVPLSVYWTMDTQPAFIYFNF